MAQLDVHPTSFADMLTTLPQVGQLQEILLRPARRVPVVAVEEVRVEVGQGLEGDRFTGSSPASKRQVTLIQAEHLPVIAALSGHGRVEAATLRRNLVVAGIPLLALKNLRFTVGEVLLEGTGPCDPCRRIEEALGPGAFNAMRGMGGITARVLEGGIIRIGDRVRRAEQAEVSLF